MRPAEMFYVECRRRLCTLLDVLGAFELDHRRVLPSMFYDRISALVDQVEHARAAESATWSSSDDVGRARGTIFQAAIEDMIGKAEREIREELIEYAARLRLPPVPPSPPAPAPVAARGFFTCPRGQA